MYQLRSARCGDCQRRSVRGAAAQPHEDVPPAPARFEVARRPAFDQGQRGAVPGDKKALGFVEQGYRLTNRRQIPARREKTFRDERAPSREFFEIIGEAVYVMPSG